MSVPRGSRQRFARLSSEHWGACRALALALACSGVHTCVCWLSVRGPPCERMRAVTVRELPPAGGLGAGPELVPVPLQVVSFRRWWFSLCFLFVS